MWINGHRVGRAVTNADAKRNRFTSKDEFYVGVNNWLIARRDQNVFFKCLAQR
jgi:hypothetical protein